MWFQVTFLAFSFCPLLPSISPPFLIQQSNHNFQFPEFIMHFHPSMLHSLPHLKNRFLILPDDTANLSLLFNTELSVLICGWDTPTQAKWVWGKHFLHLLYFVLTREEAQRKGSLLLFLNVWKAIFREWTSGIFQAIDLGPMSGHGGEEDLSSDEWRTATFKDVQQWKSLALY